MAEKRIMGMKLIVPEGLRELEVDSAIEYANELYNKDFELYTTADTNVHRARTILKIVMELQAIKGNQASFLDKDIKKVDDLIKKIDKLGLSD